MKIHSGRFNIYLAVLFAVGLVSGCQSPEKRREKQVSVLRLHLEAPPDPTERTQIINFHRENPVPVSIMKAPFVTEQNVDKASIVDTLGAYAVRLEFDRRGKLLLEQWTGANPGKRMLVFATFGVNEKGDPAHQRWLAAPKITKRISDGVLVFAPDATREELDDLIIGLNNAAKKYGDD